MGKALGTSIDVVFIQKNSGVWGGKELRTTPEKRKRKESDKKVSGQLLRTLRNRGES